MSSRVRENSMVRGVRGFLSSGAGEHPTRVLELESWRTSEGWRGGLESI